MCFLFLFLIAGGDFVDLGIGLVLFLCCIVLDLVLFLYFFSIVVSGGEVIVGFIDLDVLQFLGKNCFNMMLDPIFCIFYVFICFYQGKGVTWVMAVNSFNYR